MYAYLTEFDAGKLVRRSVPEKTLIIFDEVQDCPKVINSMKYFCENAPQYHCLSGVHFGIALAKPSSFSCWQSLYAKLIL